FTRGSRLYQALGGTLFLQSIHVMPPALQARLVRVLSQRSAMLEPAEQRVPVNIRAVIAADREFDMACRDGRIQSELHSSPTTLRINLPGLQPAAEEVPVLAGHLLEDICKDAN